jgi:hypothetical protein
MKPPDGGPPSSHEEETSARPPDARAELIAKQTAELIEAGIPPETARAMAETNVDADLRQREKDIKPPVEVNEPTKDELAEVETALDEERTPEVHSDEASDAERKDVEAALEEEHRREAEAEAKAEPEAKTETKTETKAEAKDAEKPKSLGERIKEGSERC